MTALSDLIMKVGITPIPKTSEVDKKRINKAVRDSNERSRIKKDKKVRTMFSDGHRIKSEIVPLSQLKSRSFKLKSSDQIERRLSSKDRRINI